MKPVCYRYFLFQLLALLGGLSAALPVYAFTYGAGLENSEWHVERSPLECRLWQPIPRFGTGVFSHKAGEGLHFYLHASDSAMAPGMAQIRVEGPHWKPGVEARAIGEVAVKDTLTPLEIARPYADMMLAQLHQGLVPTILAQNRFSEDHPQIKVAVSTVNFESAFDDYEDCLTQLLPVSYRQIARSAIFYAPGKTTLAPDVREQLTLIARYVKADERITRVVIDGHTDATGDRHVNLKVSQQRASRVVAYLRQAGISQKRLMSRYHGDRYPVASNETRDGRARNRRVTIRLDRE